jgi:hypothetical protein
MTSHGCKAAIRPTVLRSAGKGYMMERVCTCNVCGCRFETLDRQTKICDDCLAVRPMSQTGFEGVIDPEFDRVSIRDFRRKEATDGR